MNIFSDADDLGRFNPLLRLRISYEICSITEHFCGLQDNFRFNFF